MKEVVPIVILTFLYPLSSLLFPSPRPSPPPAFYLRSFVNGVQDTVGGPGTFTPTYFNLNAASSAAEILNVRNGRTGHLFLMVGFGCLMSGNMFYFPKKATKREHEIALKLEAVDRLPEREDLWKPLHWRMMNFM